MTAEERAYNYASTQKPTKLQVGEIAKHYNEGYNQATQDIMEKAEEFLYLQLNNGSIECGNIERLIDDFKNYMEDK